MARRLKHDRPRLHHCCITARVWQLMGGRFRSLLPSDLFKAGACARESLPAPRGAEYASEINKEELKRIFRR